VEFQVQPGVAAPVSEAVEQAALPLDHLAQPVDLRVGDSPGGALGGQTVEHFPYLEHGGDGLVVEHCDPCAACGVCTAMPS